MNEIDEFLSRWSAAEKNQDAAALDRLLADDFVAVGPLGFLLPRPAYLERQRMGLRYEAFALDEVQTRLHGDTAIVVLRMNARGTHQGRPIPEAARTTLVLQRDGGGWRLLATQHSFIAGTPGAPTLPAPAKDPPRPRV